MSESGKVVVTKSKLDGLANAINDKAKSPGPKTIAQLTQTVNDIKTGGSITSGAPGDITFYDYDGTIVTSWTLEELATKTALPDYPSHEGLTCQGWNWFLPNLKTTNRKMNVGAMYITDDGKTRIYIRLEEGRTSPMLGVCPNGTVTVDWGDGTTPDILTGTSTKTVKWTPNHAYAAPGEYVIKLMVNGTMGFYGNSASNNGGAILRYSSSNDNRNYVYKNSVQKIEIGSGVTRIAQYAFTDCYSLASITIPNGVTSIENSAFKSCRSLASITIPNGVTSIGQYTFSTCGSLASITIPTGVTSIENGTFNYCCSLESITIPNGVTSIGDDAFSNCYSLASITIPNDVTRIGNYAFYNCYPLASITIPTGVKNIGRYAFANCYSPASITIPTGVTNIGNSAFLGCYSLTSITIPNGVTSIGDSMFSNCYGVTFYDFTACRSVPTLVNKTAFNGIAADCQIRVPASLVYEWRAATNWADYFDKIVGV